MKKCEPAASIVTLLGGAERVAKATGRTKSAIHRWSRPASNGGTGGLIPKKYHASLIGLAGVAGVILPVASFVDPALVPIARKSVKKWD